MTDSLKRAIEAGTVHGDNVYHSVPELGIKGARDNVHRLGRLDLPQDMSGLFVLDIGCNLGTLSVECAKRGANPVGGVDTREAVEAAREYQDSLAGDFQRAVFVEADCLTWGDSDFFRVTLDAKPGICLFLSMYKLLGIPNWLRHCEHVVHEHNNMRYLDAVVDRYKRLGFKTVRICGKTEDFGDRAIIKAWKKEGA